MLVLNRKVNQKIIINGEIEITVLAVDSGRGQVKLGISAPQHYSIYREEIWREIEKENKEAVGESIEKINFDM
ncbi:carbon storage regulator CsrA [Carboxydothermus hydrogenoformans]|uniref:Translational regulator CsrA n=1 Tax=Carboxydothermus hydrogenoformans (strain ATCC BAA-161 / DSM 6008 / Z-2901) TaxID=246194 RepID=Q3ADG2_CARHZ|nr:carbon storage regulator CsrA [Carboxydothermus hydrogenoformans]ABB14302.1 carbon storage regulator [Carboxydothermus hydrogenoformans Z-2901]